jgi:hypothetical protein
VVVVVECSQRYGCRRGPAVRRPSEDRRRNGRDRECEIATKKS